MTDKDNDPVDEALAVARDALATPVPAGLVERVVAAALAQPREAHTWWTAVFPAAWRAAVCVNAVAAAIVLWMMITRPATAARPDPIDAVIDDETSAVLGSALGLHGRAR